MRCYLTEFSDRFYQRAGEQIAPMEIIQRLASSEQAPAHFYAYQYLENAMPTANTMGLAQPDCRLQ